MSFEDELQVELDEARGDLTRQLVKIGFEARNGVVEKTPVDTGNAQNSWDVEIGAEPSDEAGSDINGTDSKLRQAKLGDIIHVFNNTVYIRPLENGWSAQSPAGMVSVTLAELQSKYGGGF